MFDTIRYDLEAFQSRDPAATSKFQIFFLYNGFHALLFYRISHWLYRHHRYFLARWVSQYAKFRTGVEIHPAAKIGKGVLIDHGTGIVIGETAEVGDDCTLYQGVTLGGTGKDVGKRHPTIGKHVMIGSGAKVLGPFTVGDHCKIAANAVVLNELPPHSTAVGVPAHITRQNGKKVEPEDELDQIHIPDPIQQEINQLQAQIHRLEEKLAQLTAEKEEENQ